VDKLDVGLLAGISGEEMNANFNELRRTFRAEAINEEKVLDKAKLRADSVMQLLIGPVVKSINPRYAVEVRYKGGEQTVDPNELRRQGMEAAPAQPKQKQFIPQ
jgi:hypothetical protein